MKKAKNLMIEVKVLIFRLTIDSEKNNRKKKENLLTESINMSQSNLFFNCKEPKT